MSIPLIVTKDFSGQQSRISANGPAGSQNAKSEADLQMCQMVNAENNSTHRRAHVIFISNLVRDSVPDCSLGALQRRFRLNWFLSAPGGPRRILVPNIPDGWSAL
jgi:hypothetical protein